MFPLQQNSNIDELVFGTPTSHLGYQLQEDDENNYINFSTCSNDNNTTDLGFRRRRRRWQKECSMRKVVMHREVERKRRQYMSNLYASLRSLLPPHHHQIKGNTSVCDELEEAESHIKEMEKNIKELKSRRDKLKRNIWFDSSNDDEISTSNSVTVNTSNDGMEILIKTEDLGLSRIVAELQKIDYELDVVTIVSTRINGRFLHKILVQTNLGVLMLQDRLMNAMK